MRHNVAASQVSADELNNLLSQSGGRLSVFGSYPVARSGWDGVDVNTNREQGRGLAASDRRRNGGAGDIGKFFSRRREMRASSSGRTVQGGCGGGKKGER